MNNLQNLIKLKGLTIKQISQQIGHGYHSTQKVIKGATRKRSDGSVIVRSNRAIETKVATLLGLSHQEAWGPEASIYLRQAIREEIREQAKQQELEMQEEYLDSHNVTKKRTGGNV